MTTLRPLLRTLAYQTGALSLTRSGVRHALTAVMFHRVIDPADPDYAQADPVYTVSAPLFDQLLGFFGDHYAVVDVQRVIDAIEGNRPLPDHALLITFDDGWADNFRYAAPLLHARAMPAVIFVAAQAVQAIGKAWWQEEVFALDRAGGLRAWLACDGNQQRITGATSAAATVDPVDIVTRLALMDEGQRTGILATLPRTPVHARMMMEADEVRSLAGLGVAVGLHGDRHVPLSSLADPATELANAREAVARLSGGTAVTTVLGCPHGLYDDKAIAAAREVGITAVFTSDKFLNATDQGMLTTPRPLGRIGITAAHIQAAPHKLDAAAAARWLWPRPRR